MELENKNNKLYEILLLRICIKLSISGDQSAKGISGFEQ